MKHHKIISYLLVMTVISSCASHQKGNYADILKGEHPDPLPITAFVDESKSTENFKVINIQFNNESDDWVRVKKAYVKNINNKAIINITKGEDIQDWKNSFLTYNKIENHNSNMAFVGAIGLAALGTVAGIATGNGELAHGSHAVMQGTAAVHGIDSIDDSVEDLENSKLRNENYLSKKFSIPPGFVQKKWVLLQVSKKKDLKFFDFVVVYKNKKKQKVKKKVTYRVKLI